MDLNLTLQKQYLRDKFKNIKASIDINEKIYKDNIIKEKIFDMKEYIESTIIFGYMANNIEINIDNLLLKSINIGKKIAIPRCENFNGQPSMDFYFINDFNDIVVGNFSIREPNKIENKIFKKDIDNEKVIMFIPGLVYDKLGFRVGYGKGYYDRYLSKNKFKFLKIGLSYDIALIDKIEKQENDVPVDILITETKIIRLNKGYVYDNS